MKTLKDFLTEAYEVDKTKKEAIVKNDGKEFMVKLDTSGDDDILTYGMLEKGKMSDEPLDASGYSKADMIDIVGAMASLARISKKDEVTIKCHSEKDVKIVAAGVRKYNSSFENAGYGKVKEESDRIIISKK